MDLADHAFEDLLRKVAETAYAPRAEALVKPGMLLAGRFEIVEKLGEGGMGQVFAAVDHVHSTRIALKLLGRLTAGSIAAIKREFRAAADIVNTNLVRLHELISDGDLWFFTMDLVDGVSLWDLLHERPGGRRDIDLLRSIFGQLALALNALHETKILHRDLKPSNFIITDAGQRVVLLDFGLARPSLSRPNDFAGTPDYMAPEQVAGEPLTEAADWYAFGVVLHEVLTGTVVQDQVAKAALSDAHPQLAELCLRLLRPNPPDRPGADEVLGALGVSTSEPVAARQQTSSRLIGRLSELASLEAAFEQAVAGSPAIVVLDGPSGIGKSALVASFVRSVRARGGVVLAGRCRERESMGYKAIDGLIDSIATFLEELPEHEAAALLPPNISDLAVLFPALGAAASAARMAPNRSITPDRRIARLQAIAAFRTLFAHLRGRSSVILWIDDLQWSDVESALLLGPLLGGPAAVPVLFIGSTRGGPGGGPLLDALARDRTLRLPDCKRLHLAPLALEQAECLALELLHVNDKETRQVARKIAGEAGGHPLFIAELAHNALFPSRVAGGADPSTLVELVTKRVASLPRQARAFLELAAVAGAPLQRDVLRRTEGLGSAGAERIIDFLRANRLLRSEGLRDEDFVDVHHDRIREIVLQCLTGEQARSCHVRLARTLEVRGDASPETIASHYQSGAEPQNAGRYWILAADQSLRALAFGHAAELYEKGLAQAVLQHEEARAVEIRRAEALAYSGRGVHAADAYLVTADRCPADQAVDLRRRAAEQLLLSGHLDRGLSVIEEVLKAIELPPTRTGRKALISLVVRRAYLRARGLRHRVRTEGELSRSQLAQLEASWTIASSLGAVDFMRGAEFQSTHLLLALRAGEPRRLLRALMLQSAYAATPGPGSERRTADLLAVAHKLALTNQDDTATSLLCLTRGIAAYLQGQVYDALKHCEEAIYIITRRSVGAVWEMVTAQRFMVASLFFLGKLRRLTEFVPPLLAEAERNGNLYAMMCFRSAYSTVSWLAGDAVPEARRQLDRARTEWNAAGFQLSHCNLLIGETFLDFYIGDVERAFARFQEQWPLILNAQLHRISVLRVQLRHLRASCELLQANVLEARGQRAGARQLRGIARRSVRLLRRDPVRRAGALADLLEAAADNTSGDSGRSLQLLERAIAAFDAQGMALFSAAARVRLGNLLGDERGRLLAETGLAEIRHEGGMRPGRIVALLAPGFLDR